MRAHKGLAGKPCPGCAAELCLGDEVWNCPACGASHHAACRENAGGCMAEACFRKAASTPAAPGGEPETKACPYCGEAILKAAKKCRHCKEILSPALRSARERASKGSQSKAGRDALICGIVGLIICQPILGPMAIVKGTQAHKAKVDTGMGTAGIVLGILDCLVFLVYLLTKAAGIE
jgi:hypothetical protein